MLGIPEEVPRRREANVPTCSNCLNRMTEWKGPGKLEERAAAYKTTFRLLVQANNESCDAWKRAQCWDKGAPRVLDYDYDVHPVDRLRRKVVKEGKP